MKPKQECEFNEIVLDPNDQEPEFILWMWRIAVFLLAVELLLMMHFIYKIYQAINSNQNHIAAETFKSIKYNIIFSDFVIEFFITIWLTRQMAYSIWI